MVTFFKRPGSDKGEVRLRTSPDLRGDPAFCFAQFQNH
jgi:hypothetical protein